MKAIIYVVIVFSLYGTFSVLAETGVKGNLGQVMEKDKLQLHEALRTYSQNSRNLNYKEDVNLTKFMSPKSIDGFQYDVENISMAKLPSLGNSAESEFSRILQMQERVQSRRYDPSTSNIKIAWDTERFDQCQNVKRKKLGIQTQGGIASPYEEVEKSFYQSCLSKPNPTVQEDSFNRIVQEDSFNRIKDRLGILYMDNLPICTVLQLSQKYIITARHCFFDVLIDGGTKSDVILNKIGKMNLTWEIKFPFQNKVVKDTQANIIYLPIVEGSTTQFVKYDYLNINGGISLKNVDSRRQDYILLEVQDGILAQAENIKIENYQKDEKIYFYGYYSPYWKFDELKDGYGFMQSDVGRCQVLKKDSNNNCIYHGCSTIEGNSGTPLLVYRDHQFKIIGIHSSANAKESSCYTQDKTVSWANIGLTILDVNNFLK